MRFMRVALRLSLVVFLAGCYHAVVETGLTPSPVTIEKHWASGWIYGLVPPSTVETMQKCPSGVAKVETQLSFPNMLVGWITLDIYTPMDIVVTCAQAGKRTSLLPSRMINVGPNASAAQADSAMGRAVALARHIGGPVYLSF
ncbi:MAG: hypothetical protein ABR998_10540 [Gemmatimonadales bacterium]|jgi:hypothetical protein